MLDRIPKWFCRICTFILVVLLVGITVFALVNVVGRYLFQHTIFWVEEVTALVMGWMVAFAVPLLWIEENHIVMNALDYMLNEEMKYWWSIVVDVIAFFIGVIFLYAGLKAYRINSGYSTSLLQYDESIRYLFVPVMGGLLSFASFLTLIKKSRTRVKEERHGN